MARLTSKPLVEPTGSAHKEEQSRAKHARKAKHENAEGEGEGEGNTQGRSLRLVQLSRGRAAEEECNTCGNTDGHACTSDADGKGEGEE